MTTQREKRRKSLGRFIAARAEYLKEAGWVPKSSANVGSPIWWRDPNSASLLREDLAVKIQVRRDNKLR